jgi:hypothetical protein
MNTLFECVEDNTIRTYLQSDEPDSYNWQSIAEVVAEMELCLVKDLGDERVPFDVVGARQAAINRALNAMRNVSRKGVHEAAVEFFSV